MAMPSFPAATTIDTTYYTTGRNRFGFWHNPVTGFFNSGATGVGFYLASLGSSVIHFSRGNSADTFSSSNITSVGLTSGDTIHVNFRVKVTNWEIFNGG